MKQWLTILTEKKEMKNPSRTSIFFLVLFQVKEFHPDVCKDAGDSDLMIRRVIQAYKVG